MTGEGLLRNLILFYIVVFKWRGVTCGQVDDFAVDSWQEQQFILELHNRARWEVGSGRVHRGSPGPQPPATDMSALVWDDDLASAAWEWAQNRQFVHDPNLRDMQMGQNLAISYSSRPYTSPDWANRAFNLWYSEVDQMDCRTVTHFRNVKAPNGQDIGHYTQLVWAGTMAVGCAAIGYTDYSMPNMPYRQLYVCNYSPAGNIIGQPVYRADFSSSNCPVFRG